MVIVKLYNNSSGWTSIQNGYTFQIIALLPMLDARLREKNGWKYTSLWRRDSLPRLAGWLREKTDSCTKFMGGGPRLWH